MVGDLDGFKLKTVQIVLASDMRFARALTIAGDVGKACAHHSVSLLLGGAGRWPERSHHGVPGARRSR
jgi:hypothetical protein